MATNELIYTDGACSGNGTARSTGGFGVFIANTSVFPAPIKINQKGVHMKFNDQTLYVTNIRMEGLAIVSTLALYAHTLIDGIGNNDAIQCLNSIDPFNVKDFKVSYSPDELKEFKAVPTTTIEIVTDSQFWINVVETWMPSWARKGIVMQKKNPDILLMCSYYMEKLKQNGITVLFTHVKSHQKGKRSAHADGNDVADVLATSAVKNHTTNFEAQA